MRPSFKEHNPGKSGPEIDKLIDEAWKHLDADGRAKYKEMAAVADGGNVKKPRPKKQNARSFFQKVCYKLSCSNASLA